MAHTHARTSTRTASTVDVAISVGVAISSVAMCGWRGGLATFVGRHFVGGHFVGDTTIKEVDYIN